MEIDMTREEAIKELRGFIGQLTEGCQEAIKVLIPELAESEDERIRKAIIKLLKEIGRDDTGISENAKCMIAYLEKQKERGPLTKEEEYTLQRIIEYLEDESCPSEWISLLHDIYCLPYEKQKEPKHAPCDLQKAFEDGQASIVTEPEKYGLQKPEWGDEDEVYLQDALWCVKQASTIARGENDMGACWSAEKWLNSLKNRGISLSWGDEDEINLKLAIGKFEGTACDLEWDLEQRVIKWLKSLRSRSKQVYSKAPWTDIDKGILKDAITAADLLGNNEDYKKEHPHLAKAFRIAKDWLKTLPERFVFHTNQEWSDEDELMRTAIIQTLETFKGRGTTGMQIDWLKSLLPSWKPSEEQMEALDGCVYYLNESDNEDYEIVESLYNDLKKLM